MQKQDEEAFQCNESVFTEGLSSSQVKEYYNKWTDYEQDLNSERYRGPLYTAECVARWFPNNFVIKIADIGAGSGRVGEELKRLGYTCLVGVEASNIIEKADGIYHHIIPCYIGSDSKDKICADEFGCVVSSGVFGPNHMPATGINELIRISKPGGVIVTALREAYLEHLPKLEPYLEELEQLGYIQQLERKIVDNYFFDKTGLVLCHKVLVSGFSSFKSNVLKQ